MRAAGAPYTPQRAAADLLADAAGLGRDVDDAKVHHVQGVIGPEDARRRAFEAVMRQLGSGAFDLVDGEGSTRRFFISTRTTLNPAG